MAVDQLPSVRLLGSTSQASESESGTLTTVRIDGVADGQGFGLGERRTGEASERRRNETRAVEYGRLQRSQPARSDARLCNEQKYYRSRTMNERTTQNQHNVRASPMAGYTPREACFPSQVSMGDSDDRLKRDRPNDSGHAPSQRRKQPKDLIETGTGRSPVPGHRPTEAQSSPFGW